MKTSESNLTLSVVIPTIGENELVNTIDSLYNSSYKPYEVIVVVPKYFVYRLKDLKIDNITILETNFAGQVKQRIEGFKMAKGDLVLQLDSDIILSRDCLEKLVRVIYCQGHDVAVAPSYSKGEAGITKESKRLKQILALFVNLGEGSIKSKNNLFTWDAWYKNFEWPKKLSEMNYINGGCLLHWKHNLVLDDYYPYKGKAYGEDLLHSFILRKKGIRLICEPAARARTFVDAYEFSDIRSLFGFIKKTYAYKLKLVILSKGNLFRFHLWFLLFSGNQIIRAMKNYSKIMSNFTSR